MKEKTILLMLLLTVSVVGYAQKGKFRSTYQVQRAGVENNFRSIELCCDVIGYNITDRLYANLRYENATALFKENGLKTYAHNHAEGVNVGYDFIQKESHSIGVQAGVGTSAWWKSTDWDYNYYDVVAYADLGSCKVKTRFSLGVRFYDSRDTQYKNRFTLVGSIGFRI